MKTNQAVFLLWHIKLYNTYISTKKILGEKYFLPLILLCSGFVTWNCYSSPATRMGTRPTQRICSAYKQSSWRSRPWSFLLFNRNVLPHYFSGERKINLVNSHSFHGGNSVPRELHMCFTSTLLEELALEISTLRCSHRIFSLCWQKSQSTDMTVWITGVSLRFRLKL